MKGTTYHYDVLSAFNNAHYDGIFTCEDVVKPIAIKDVDEDGNDITKYFLFFQKKEPVVTNYLLELVHLDSLPIKADKLVKIPYRGEPYHLISEWHPVGFKPYRHCSFRKLVDKLADFKHSNKDDFILWKIVCLTAYLSRINVRIASNKAFGKNSMIDILSNIRNDVSSINPTTLAALEWRLHNKVLCLDEMSTLKKEQIELIQLFLLRAGGFSNYYEKSSRGSKAFGTVDKYDISNLSCVIMYNDLSYYTEVNQADRYFDMMFTKAVQDRFLPLKFNGELEIDQFSTMINPSKALNLCKDDLLEDISTIEYFKEKWWTEINDYIFDSKTYEMSGRQRKTFNEIVKFIDMYSNSQEEFDKFVNLLHQKYVDYNLMVSVNKFKDGTLI